jgi:hypothetical protein
MCLYQVKIHMLHFELQRSICCSHQTQNILHGCHAFLFSFRKSDTLMGTNWKTLLIDLTLIASVIVWKFVLKTWNEFHWYRIWIFYVGKRSRIWSFVDEYQRFEEIFYSLLQVIWLLKWSWHLLRNVGIQLRELLTLKLEAKCSSCTGFVCFVLLIRRIQMNQICLSNNFTEMDSNSKLGCVSGRFTY